MPFSLLKYGFARRYPARRDIPETRNLKPSYDVVIVGGGGHALATAYYLSCHQGITNVAVLEKGYLAGGNTARNTTIIRSNYTTPEGIAFYKESVALFAGLSEELDYNVMFSRRGHLALAHSSSDTRSQRWRAEINRHFGVRSRLIDADEVGRLIPLDRTPGCFPVVGALWHEDGGIARHDAVAWAFARQASLAGVEVHQQTPVTGVVVEKGRARGVRTPRGDVAAGCIVQAVAGHSSRVAELAGIRLPIESRRLQACVTQPLKPFLDPIVSSSSLGFYMSQSARGELVIGGEPDDYALYSTRSTLEFKAHVCASILEIFPFLAGAKIMRQWAGIVDMTPDYSPILGVSPVENYYLDAGWGTWGFKATPVTGKRMAELVATGRTPALIAPFALSRFDTMDLVDETGSTTAGH